jgi:hypothetical protein
VEDTQTCCSGATFGASPPFERNDKCCGLGNTTNSETSDVNATVTVHDHTDHDPFAAHYAHYDSNQQICCSQEFSSDNGEQRFFTHRPSSREFTYKNKISQARCCGKADYDHEEARCCDLEGNRPAPYLPHKNDS